MPILKRTQYTGRITFLGRMANSHDPIHAEPADTLTATFDGIEGETHAGATVPSCSRMMPLYPRGTQIANTRQVSILCADELAQIAAQMDLETLSPSLLGATMVIEGLPDLSYIPPGSRLQGRQTTLVVNLNNRPCTIPSKAIEAAHPGKGKLFKPAAEGRRGLVAWVERPGALTLGEEIALFIPDQRPWMPPRLL
ncbi:sulfurase [Rhodobacter sp. KR11]|uniref:MOSC domain-containing protein n=1 Tax=Rhodobacter sp. KR11 TaxID=2974588 RepID=UPI0022235EF7|nr:sulfurase [Rhodobacter sp. KR11]MCW1919156.1 sulfurase [Rhodobacter sp. KR11]